MEPRHGNEPDFKNHYDNRQHFDYSRIYASGDIWF